MPNGIRVNAPHAVIGLCVMGLGVALALDRLGIVPAEQVLQYWPIGLVLLGGAMVFQAIRSGPNDTVRAGFPIGAAIWLVIIGLLVTHVFERRGSARDNHQNQVRLFSIMGGDRRSVVDTPFHGADITAIMGGANLDLRKARVAPGEEVVVDVFAMMGGAELYVPRDWVVDVQAISVMGGIKDARNPGAIGQSRRRAPREGIDVDLPPPQPVPPIPPVPSVESTTPVERADADTQTAAAPRLVVRGFVMMGGMEIKP